MECHARGLADFMLRDWCLLSPRSGLDHLLYTYARDAFCIEETNVQTMNCDAEARQEN